MCQHLLDHVNIFNALIYCVQKSSTIAVLIKRYQIKKVLCRKGVGDSFIYLNYFLDKLFNQREQNVSTVYIVFNSRQIQIKILIQLLRYSFGRNGAGSRTAYAFQFFIFICCG